MSNAKEQLGLVISYFGNSVAVEAENGQVIPCHLHRNQELPVVGDKVRWQMEDADTGVVVGIEPRRSLLARGAGHDKIKPIVANVDAMVIVMAPPPIFSEYLVDRYLIAAELLNIQPMVVMNKADLLNTSTRPDAQIRLQAYRDIPYPVLLTSAIQHDGLPELTALLKNKTAVLVGPSGVGKSSIIAALNETDSIRVGEVSAKGAGKHTTTATRLYHLPQGGQLIDSPGVREFNLWTITPHDVLKGFKEFHAHTEGCKFRDCAHLVEPGCAVQAAVQNGRIYPKRYAHYQELVQEMNGKKRDW